MNEIQMSKAPIVAQSSKKIVIENLFEENIFYIKLKIYICRLG
jgi:hypothetical protein